MAATTILAGDLGGTKTNLALFSSEKGPVLPLAEASFRSREFANIESIINVFLARHDLRVDAAFLGVAGPVTHGRAKITNLGWRLSAEQIQSSCNLTQVVLVNDLVNDQTPCTFSTSSPCQTTYPFLKIINSFTPSDPEFVSKNRIA